jgi:hypothetical protein
MIIFAYWIIGVAPVQVAVGGAIIATGRVAERVRASCDISDKQCPLQSILLGAF